MMRFVADKNKNEFTTAGNMATAAINVPISGDRYGTYYVYYNNIQLKVS